MLNFSDFPTILSAIRVVMVNTTLPANIGSAARAMYTMGLSDFVVVAPKLPIDDDALAHAAGATELLANARVVDSLDDAIADCHWVFATSSRQRHIPKPVLSPRQAASFYIEQLEQLNSESDLLKTIPKIALIFGREDRGLTNDELALANYHIQIPANPDYSVLNVAAAVQVITASFFEVIESHLQAPQDLVIDKGIALNFRQDWDKPPISRQQQQQLEQKLLKILQDLGIYHREQSKVLPQRVARLFDRLQLDVKEYQLLQAFFAKIQQ